MTADHRSTPTAVPGTIAPDELDDLLEAAPGVLVLDVRTPAEFETARITGSRNLPLDQLKRERDGLPDYVHTASEVVVTCQSGGRAREAADVLVDAGVGQLRVLEGGLGRWRREERPVVEGRRTWEMERQVRLVAGSIVLSSTLASITVPRAKWVAAAVGGGLTFAALSDTCAMGLVLSRMPWNRRGAGS